MQEESIQKLVIENGKKLFLTGVTSVDGFSEQIIKLTVGGNKVIILGDNIKITGYSKGTGTLTADGKFSSLKLSESKAPIIKRIFK